MSRRLLGILLVLVSLIILQLASGISTTPALWTSEYRMEIPFSPCRFRNLVAVIGGSKELAVFNPEGELVKRIDLPHDPCHPPFELASTVVVVDREAGVRAYGEGTLNLLWERAMVIPPRPSPVVLPGNRLLLATTASALFAVDGATGQPDWKADFPGGEVVAVSVSSSVACIFGSTDHQKSNWKLRAIDPELGREKWTFPEFVLEQTPIAYRDMFIFVNAKGAPVGVDQVTGAIRFRVPGEGYRVVLAGEDRLLLLAQGGTRVDCYSLAGGSSWSTTLPGQFVKAVIVGKRVMVADRQVLRCIEVATGELCWQKDLGPILVAYPHRNGMCVLFKQSSHDSRNLFAFFPVTNGKPEWICAAEAMFHPPITFPGFDFVACRSGRLFGMPVGSE